MRINTNVAALRACYQLNSTDSKLSTSLEKLSSGNKLLDIKENPVGASLSVKMKTQIRNLDRATQNTNDGISVVETAEGALSEIQSMLQRINELAVQGASDTYGDDDRTAIMDEIEQIRDEIDRVSEDTDFNTQTLLDGTFARRTYSAVKYADITYVSETVKAGNYIILYQDTATQATLSLAELSEGNIPNGSFEINGATVRLSENDTLQDVYEKLVEAGDKTDISVSYFPESLTQSTIFTFTQKGYGSAETIDISASKEMAAALGLASEEVSVAGQDGTAEVYNYEEDPDSLFKKSTLCNVSGREITIKDFDGFEMKIQITAEIEKDPNPTAEKKLTFGVTDVGPMTIQVGANEYQELDIEIPKVSSETLGLDKINALTARGCGEAITISNDAINRISEIRSSIGAYQNRMEHTISTLEVTEENMTASLSRIEDLDMADEMTKYTTYNVMTQAATSMLAQANQMADKVLQLLQ